MSRFSFALVLAVGLLAGALGTFLLRPTNMLTPADVRGIVTDALKQDKPAAAMAELDAGKVNKLIEDYLLSDPTILQRMISSALTIDWLDWITDRWRFEQAKLAFREDCFIILDKQFDRSEQSWTRSTKDW